MIVENLFEDTIFPNLKEYVETNSIYSPLLTKAMPQESKKFPIVPVRLLPVTNKYNNLSYGEQTYTFAIDINVYAQDKTVGSKRISRRTICNEVSNKIVDYFANNFHVTIRTELDVPNVVSNVHRNNIKITGKLDTKYGLDKLVIYPN
ncbi:MAG: hypothetical protein KH135_00610 [Firmicutes bacterium]|nr:hypothetical protein [Bacillota bacterium]